MAAFGLLVLRATIGLIVTAHGAQKLFGWWGGPGMTGWVGAMTRMRLRPAVPWAWMSALAEVLGGVAFATGFLSPLGSFAITGSMLVAIALVHMRKGFWVTKGGFEFNLAIVGAAIGIALTGPGPLSLDGLFGIHLQEPATFIIVALATLAGVGIALGTRGPAEATKPQAV